MSLSSGRAHNDERLVSRTHRTFETRSKELSSRCLSDLWILFLAKKHSGKPELYWLDSDHIILRSKHLSSRRRCRRLTSDRCLCRRCSSRRSARPVARRPSLAPSPPPGPLPPHPSRISACLRNETAHSNLSPSSYNPFWSVSHPSCSVLMLTSCVYPQRLPHHQALHAY